MEECQRNPRRPGRWCLRSVTVEVFDGDSPGPQDLGDVVFFTVPYDRPFGTEPIPRLSGVQVIQALTAGYDHLFALLPGDLTLCNARGLHDASTAEHALGLILAAQRELPRWIRAQRQGRWDHAHTRSLAGCRVLIVGYGSIGSALDARLRTCEAETVRVARRPRLDEQVHAVADLDGLLPTTDIVVLLRRSPRRPEACWTPGALPCCPTGPWWSTSAAARCSTPARWSPRRPPAGSARHSTSPILSRCPLAIHCGSARR